MINCLLTVGNHTQSFYRLIDYCVSFSKYFPGEFSFTVQYGHTKIDKETFSKKDIVVDFFDRNTFIKVLSSVDCVITHSGIGTINDAIEYGHYPIIVPRLLSKKEHTDPSQPEVCQYFNSINKAFCLDKLPTFRNFYKIIVNAKSKKKDPITDSWTSFQQLILSDIKNLGSL